MKQAYAHPLVVNPIFLVIPILGLVLFILVATLLDFLIGFIFLKSSILIQKMSAVFKSFLLVNIIAYPLFLILSLYLLNESRLFDFYLYISIFHTNWLYFSLFVFLVLIFLIIKYLLYKWQFSKLYSKNIFNHQIENKTIQNLCVVMFLITIIINFILAYVLFV